MAGDQHVRVLWAEDPYDDGSSAASSGGLCATRGREGLEFVLRDRRVNPAREIRF